MAEIPEWLMEIEHGYVPNDEHILERLTVGREIWFDPFVSHYLDLFIKGENGKYGSKVKFLISNPGGGKTHFLRLLSLEARKRNYQAVYLKASEFRFHYIQDLYSAVINSLDIEKLLTDVRTRIIRELGYEYCESDDEDGFISRAQEKEDIANLRKTIREKLTCILGNKRMDRYFAIALMSLIYNDLEYGKKWKKPKDPQQRQTLLDWMKAVPELPLPEIKKANIYSRINRQNARRMLCSLAEFVRIAGYTGLVICLDDLNDLLSPKQTTGRGHKYTKMAREDAYESIREIIDDQEGLQGILFVMGSRRELIDNERDGIKTYQALWMRIQEEINPKRSFNPFVDLIDLDRMWEIYGKEKIIRELSGKLMEEIRKNGFSDLRPPDEETLQWAIKISPFNMRRAIRIIAAYILQQINKGEAYE